ncbi:DsbA family protein [Aestuariivirga litoralis]|uniref:DsbA family protein n=1 Tax=Aestuariivirga litoralis TaxID=2650924 RepID=UPI0018C6C495|nr:DsbA family protein [Aestuariivirga litoralis]MBG1231910.1 DsbA family protein [Aestuariivirga litoralis]
MKRILISLGAFLLASVVAAAAFAGSFSDDQKKEMEDIIHSYLMEHPDVLKEMVAKLDAADKQAADEARGNVLSSASKDIFHNALDGVAGNPKGDVTVVEFMDYNCGWCHKSVTEMQAVIGKDKNVRLVLKEFPIFGEGSEYAARAAMASQKQGKYWEFHQAMFATKGKIDAAVTDKVAQSVGLDITKLKADMKDPEINANIDKTQALAKSLQFTGTPGFIVGDKIFPGFTQQDNIIASIAATRAEGGCKFC